MDFDVGTNLKGPHAVVPEHAGWPRIRIKIRERIVAPVRAQETAVGAESRRDGREGETRD